MAMKNTIAQTATPLTSRADPCASLFVPCKFIVVSRRPDGAVTDMAKSHRANFTVSYGAATMPCARPSIFSTGARRCALALARAVEEVRKNTVFLALPAVSQTGATYPCREPWTGHQRGLRQGGCTPISRVRVGAKRVGFAPGSWAGIAAPKPGGNAPPKILAGLPLSFMIAREQPRHG
jgi:hypothetical protein